MSCFFVVRELEVMAVMTTRTNVSIYQCLLVSPVETIQLPL